MSFLAQSQIALRGEIDRALALFGEAGAVFVDVSTLLPADLMLDLYGEDIRNRAFLVQDGVEGNFVLRPDFTIPVLEAHLERDEANARYAYSGRVWRKRREQQSAHQHSFWQLGIEIFDENWRAENDAEAFLLATKLAEPFDFQIKTGDLGLAFSLLDQMEMSDWRRRALKRQFWRPKAFEALLTRYSQGLGKHADLKPVFDAPIIGLRSEAMILSRIERLKEDAKAPPLRAGEVEALRQILALQGSLDIAGKRIEKLAENYPLLEAAAKGFLARNQALDAAGIDLKAIHFDASFGRETMEYYDGFVFAFHHGESAVISGGRYDQLARKFNATGKMSAVGLAYRPELALGENLEGEG